MSRIGDRAGTKSGWRAGFVKHYGVKAARNIRATTQRALAESAESGKKK